MFLFTDPTISGFSVILHSFVGVQSSPSCSDSDPYDNFTLTCTASKPVLVVPDLEVILYHNGTVRNRMILLQNDNTSVTNTLSFPTSVASDSGVYTCLARLVIPDSLNITITEQSTITLRCKCLI